MSNNQVTREERVKGWTTELTLRFVNAELGKSVMAQMAADSTICASFIADVEVFDEYLVSVEIWIPQSLVEELGFADHYGEDLQWTLYAIMDAFVDEATEQVRSRTQR